MKHTNSNITAAVHPTDSANRLNNDINLKTTSFFYVNRARSECHGCTAALRPIALPYPSPILDIPTSAATYLHACNDARDPSSERWNLVSEKVPVILPK
jgi:hypothetical protein